MESTIILSGIGQDRPGIVHGISNVIARHDGNISVQRSIKLGGEFAIILMFTLPTDDAAASEAVTSELAALASDDFQIEVRESTGPAEEERSTLELSITGVDQPGIIDSLTLFLFEQGVNIRAMDYSLAHAAFSAAPLFNAHLLISLPDGFDEARFKNGLQEIEQNLNVDVELKEPEGRH